MYWSDDCDDQDYDSDYDLIVMMSLKTSITDLEFSLLVCLYEMYERHQASQSVEDQAGWGSRVRPFVVVMFDELFATVGDNPGMV